MKYEIESCSDGTFSIWFDDGFVDGNFRSWYEAWMIIKGFDNATS